MGGEQRNFELSVPQILGSALAAVTAAVAASFLGVAGTVIGAAVMSVASTVGTAVYTHYLKRTGERVRLRPAPPRREGREEAAPGTGEGEGEGRGEGQGRGGDTLVMPVVEAEQPRRRLPWGRVALAAGLVFAVSMGGILVYQAAARQTVHEQVTGGTTRHKPATGERRAPVEPTVRESVPRGPSATPEADLTPTPGPTPSATPTVTATVTTTATATATGTPTAPATPEPADPQPSATAPAEPDPTPAEPAPEPDHPEAEAQPSTWSR
ncbi:hypothetical protein Nocox_30380 [Nonomuraea coxensis DSM 45129]|uniref:Uncharacterized protein n=1 Tax=Nonomuraea coxensis DSM 45129 TaxID=1122611 RepID=A0ABX8U7B9_9ACTN|nr:hypothetical protein [Nonomuraea coxensis]QYC43660.1 hypothetical protein Nocox_30380 [Nonomuraea coxensis DSM 45129]